MSDAPRASDAKPHHGNGADSQPPPTTTIFDNLDALRLDPGTFLTETVEHLAHVPVRKPGKTEFFRVHPAEDMQLPCTLFSDDEEGTSYLVTPEARPLLPGHLKPVLLVTYITRQGVLRFWPVPLPADEGTGGFRAWGETQREAAHIARTTWIRMQADKALGAYRIYKAEGVLPDPQWPRKMMSELLGIAFRDRVITGPDHPVIRKLRGLS